MTRLRALGAREPTTPGNDEAPEHKRPATLRAALALAGDGRKADVPTDHFAARLVRERYSVKASPQSAHGQQTH